MKYVWGFIFGCLFCVAVCYYFIDRAVENGQAQVFAQCSKTGAVELHGVKMVCTVGVKEIRWD